MVTVVNALAAIAVLATGACLAIVGVFWWWTRKGGK